MWNNTADKIPELTINYIIKIVNQIGPDDERLNKAFELIDNESGTEDNFTKRKKFEPFHMLGSYKVFTADTYLDTTNLSEKDALKRHLHTYMHGYIQDIVRHFLIYLIQLIIITAVFRDILSM